MLSSLICLKNLIILQRKSSKCKDEGVFSSISRNILLGCHWTKSLGAIAQHQHRHSSAVEIFLSNIRIHILQTLFSASLIDKEGLNEIKEILTDL